jgi:uncharacterized protein (DUF2147 family)
MRVLAASVILFATAAQAQEAAIDGRWVNPSGTVIIEVGPCGEARCGTVKWASDKAKADARKGTDQLVGTDLLTGLVEKKPGQWSGRLFIPDQNMRAKAKIQLISERQLKVSGCAAVVLCRTQYWNRSDGP